MVLVKIQFSSEYYTFHISALEHAAMFFFLASMNIIYKDCLSCMICETFHFLWNFLWSLQIQFINIVPIGQVLQYVQVKYCFIFICFEIWNDS